MLLGVENPSSILILGIEKQEISMKKFLVPTDFSNTSRNALHYALQLAKELEAKAIEIVHVFLPEAAGEARAWQDFRGRSRAAWAIPSDRSHRSRREACCS